MMPVTQDWDSHKHFKKKTRTKSTCFYNKFAKFSGFYFLDISAADS